MEDVLNNLEFEDALLITAPPGWGKTYKILEAIKRCEPNVLFIFPLRALCDEVYLSAQKKKIDVINLRSKKDIELLSIKNFKLVVTTPEIILGAELTNYIYILDEFHLFYYWGDTFREKMQNLYFEITAFGCPIIFLSATINEKLKERLNQELNYNYENIYHLDYGNQKLKNIPRFVYPYPSFLNRWLSDEIFFGKRKGCTLIFCKYRQEVAKLTETLKDYNYIVLDCVGGEAKEFVEKLNSTSNIDFIVATSVVSHGVNLPNLSRIIFNYHVENLDFYLQMLGRGGREGSPFDIHVKNFDYFSKRKIFLGFMGVLLKRLRNKVNKLLYYAYEY